MKAPPEVELVIGSLIVIYSAATIWAAHWRPKLLDHWAFRPRLFSGVGPRVGPVGAYLGGLLWLVIGRLIIVRVVREQI